MPIQPHNLPRKIGLIAGDGDLPEKIIAECMKSGREIFVISISQHKPPSFTKVPHLSLNIGSVGKAIKTFRAENVKEIVFAGGLKRPKLTALRPDAGGVKLLAKISQAKFIGDNSLLSIVIRFFEDSGFNILGADEILESLIMPKGVLGKIPPNKSALKDIEIGCDMARSIGKLDIGQSVIIQHGMVIGVEAVEGTDALISRCAKLLQDDIGGVLVKMKKPNQDKRIDLPTIGLTTIENAHASGLRGIAIEAGGALIIDKYEVTKKADALGLFLVGV
jgi:DUF1009 family protein